MHATLDVSALKQFTRALTCLTKYGDDLVLQATPERLLLHTTNSSATAYCRFVYLHHFFVRYRLKKSAIAYGEDDEIVEERSVAGKLSTKSLLAVLRHRTVEKTVERCELSIVDGEGAHDGGSSDEERDTLESRLVVRLHCKHGVVKTHRLLLSEASRHLAPNVPNNLERSRLSMGPRSLHDILEHFSTAKSVKNDPQLVWCFGTEEVQVRSQENSVDSKGKAQLATELSITAEEFEEYNIYAPPVTIAFHLREFSAVIAFAEASSVGLDIIFTEPSEPLFIETDGGDSYETLFVISTCQVTPLSDPNRISQQQLQQQQMRQQHRISPPHGKKRGHEEDEDSISRNSSTPQLGPTPVNPNPNPNGRTPGSVVKKKPMKAAVRTEVDSPLANKSRPAPWSNRCTPLRRTSDGSGSGSMPPPIEIPAWALTQNPHTPQPSQRSQVAGPSHVKEPLFLPSSQLSQVDEEAIRQSGLGIENMDKEEFLAMLEDEGEEVGVVPGYEHDYEHVQVGEAPMDVGEEKGVEGEGEADIDARLPDWDELERFDEIERGETQYEASQGLREDKTFRPLFDD